ncbi:helix-turn-helix transcriptional regulator [Bifidobacterium sp. ESL0763]|uniref:helix-turn-helix transcriptional regulator n=1 Tax=Bifidobacterium sp. ESL0763 TaxID=2983227 RepID=UPI0023F7D9CF|nr:helix-turn-helix transcriptional regulator [Bifidobacterium sp. ESL0763]MDF7663475.1 helix-turn-helix transcriptional regulator [Bifidobacterium sp. ESL0763]
MPSYSFDTHLAKVRKNRKMAKAIDDETQRLDAAVALMQARESAGLTQEDLAEESGVSRTTINRIEKGRISPSFRTLGTLAEAMGKRLTIGFSN